MDWHMALGQVEEVEDEDGHQRLTVSGLAGERFTRVTRLQGSGISSVPKKGARGLIAFAGNRENAYALGFETLGDRPRSGGPGETVIYGPNGETVSIVQNNVRIVVQNFTVTADEIVLNGTVYLGGKGGAKPVGRKDDPVDSTKILDGSDKVFAQ